MGIYLSYRRIDQGQFNELRRLQDEKAVVSRMSPLLEDDIFDHLEDDEQAIAPSYLSLDKLYPLVSGFLNPADAPDSPFRAVTNGGIAVIEDPLYPPGNDYLNVVYYLTQSEIQSLTHAMYAISEQEWPERYRVVMGYDTIEEALAREEFPSYDDAISLFVDVRSFFDQAAMNEQVILRWYS